ncbi:MAG: RecX family transcriptional regulator [Chloroflexi bacterium]|uniref:Regulatory protein RecX n=1 Tax=Candidatus Chlorohelix allophototropha TaxID=3003348 RepID=A0A8T7M1U4_9CHLR|nr:RecX family transcriptional regulator [Chloroflexota bacterium]WJW65595.1 RecX family transcriptional regulator [Chloroflexota bacterium L227-S17]
MFRSNKPPQPQFHGSGIITSVDTQKTDHERVNIFLDGQYAFSLTAILAAEQRLIAGKYLDAEAVAELQSADLYHRALSAALNMLSRRAHTEAEIRNKLKRAYPDIATSTVSRVLARLKELKYLDDEEFARMWVQSRTSYAPRGSLLIKRELSAKGVKEEQIDEAVNAVLATPQESEDGEERTLEEQQALELARRKAHSLAGEDWAGFYRKMGGFLARRGYNFSIINEVVREAWKELKEESPGEDLE